VLAKDKVMPALDDHARRFIALSPFLCLASSAADGRADVSPRGDPPGFVAVLDERTLLIPERKGNRRADTMLNIVENPAVGLIFFVPGIDETLRINGRATIVDDPALLAPLAVDGKAPALGVRVAVDEVFLHCAKALIRSRLWDPERRIERADFPTLGRIIVDQLAPDDMTVEAAERIVADNYKTELY